MIKTLLIAIMLLLMMNNKAFAKTTELNYKAKFGIFGTVGTIKNVLTQNSKTYSIKTKVKLAGLAKMLMGGQVEEYVSQGHMKNGLMISDRYTMTSTKKGKIVKKEYRINHVKKYVSRRYRKWIDGKLVQERSNTLKFYAKDDLLTLYFNLGKAVKEKGKTYVFKAIGLEKQQGIVNITVPSDATSVSYKKDLGNGAKFYAKALIHQKNFRKKKGDILLAVGHDGFIQKSVIKDVLMYGDAKLVRTR
jgi:hypothetical protein